MRTSAPRLQRPADRRRTAGLALAAVAALVVALLWLKPDPFAAHHDVQAQFADVSGLAAVGADVRVAGVKVGEVSARRRAGTGAQVTLRLGGAAPDIHADASATLRPTLLFEGRAYVDLRPGSAKAPPLGDAVVPYSRTSVYVPLADALEVLDRSNARNLRTDVAGAKDTFGDARVQRALNATLTQAPRLTATLARTARAALGPHQTELRSAVGRLARTARAVAVRANVLPPVVRDSDASAAALRGGPAAPLDAALARLPATVAHLRSGGSALEGTVARLRPLARELRPALRAATPAVDALRPVLRTAAPALHRVTPIVRDLRGGLDSAGPAAGPARRLVAEVSPTLATLEASLLPALERRTSLGTPAYLAFLGLFAGGGGASRPFGSGAYGHFMRFGLRFITGAGAPLPSCDELNKADAQLAQALAKAGGCTP